MSNIFSEDSEVLAESGDWQLVIYNKRCVCFLKKDGGEIKAPSLAVDDDDNGCVKPEAILIDKLCDMFIKLRKEATDGN